MAAKLYNLKLRGLNSTGALTVATLDVEYWDDGSLWFTDTTTSKRYQLPPSKELHMLIKKTLQGTNGIPSTVQLLK